MTALSVDIETRSRCDLTVRGLDAYARDPSTQVLIACYAIDDGEVKTWLPLSEPRAPADLRDALLDPAVQKWAWNAPFEREVLAGVFKRQFPNWRDTMVSALYASLPGSLEGAGLALGLPEDMLKNPEGKRLIRRFSSPRGDGSFIEPDADPDNFAAFAAYCTQDVRAERAIRNKLASIPVPESEWALWNLDQKINKRGMPVDLPFVVEAAKLAASERERLAGVLKAETGLNNPMTQAGFLNFARANGYPYGDLRRATVDKALREADLDPQLAQWLRLRLDAARTSTAKFATLLELTGADARLRNTVQFYGAQRTGRWAGRGVQIQNLGRAFKPIEGREDSIAKLIAAGNGPDLLFDFESLTPVLSGMVRTAFRAAAGKQLVMADLNAIENRGVGWLAGCNAILDVFRRDLDPYKAFGAEWLGVPYDEITPAQRTLSKPAVLGCGYSLGGGDEVQNAKGDVVKTGLWGYAEAMGITMTREQAHDAVQTFRSTYPEVVSFWYNLKDAAFDVVRNGGSVRVGKLVLHGQPSLLRIELPSGRSLHYFKPRIENLQREFRTVLEDGMVKIEKKMVQTLTYMGVGLNKQWQRIPTHAGKICENVTQAVARDVLAEGLKAADKAGFTIIGHVHDEIICEEAIGSPFTAEHLAEVMSRPLPWAVGLPLAAAGETSEVYKK